ncbi:MAG: dihydroorotase family protein [Thaumarchaeota archaeon]|nr:dihydroorotase family protein [Nitrososphaerota archaeon]
MRADLVIRGGKIVTAISIFEAGIAVEGGKIVAIGNPEDLPIADEVLKADGKIILPGVIDPHVHFRDPGFEYKEDFHSGSVAAAYGGVTTVMDMPNTLPVVSNVQTFLEKKSEAQRKSVVDFCLIAAASPSNMPDLRHLANAGAIYFKTVMGGYKASERPETASMLSLNDGDLLSVFKAVAATGRAVAVHAEGEDLREYFTNRIRGKAQLDYSAHFKSRPNLVEVEAVSRAILVAAQAGCRLHIAHMSTLGAMSLVQQARANGANISSETCPHYLFLNNHEAVPLGPNGVMNPSIKTEKDRVALWQGVKTGTIDFISTDHAPHTSEDKRAGDGNVLKTPAGVIGVETFLPLMMTEALRGRITLQQVVSLTSKNAAKLFGIYPRKGAIAIGSDADLVIVDPKRSATVTQESLHSKSKNSPFIGMRVTGIPVHTIVRGKRIMSDGELIAKPGSGKFVNPDQPPNDLQLTSPQRHS